MCWEKKKWKNDRQSLLPHVFRIITVFSIVLVVHNILITVVDTQEYHPLLSIIHIGMNLSFLVAILTAVRKHLCDKGWIQVIADRLAIGMILKRMKMKMKREDFSNFVQLFYLSGGIHHCMMVCFVTLNHPRVLILHVCILLLRWTWELKLGAIYSRRLYILVIDEPVWGSDLRFITCRGH